LHAVGKERVVNNFPKWGVWYPSFWVIELQQKTFVKEDSMLRYDTNIEQQMKTLYRSLNEKDRRAYAAVEAVKLGHGGVEFISTLFACDQKTIRRGREDINNPPELPAGRIRKKRGDETVQSTPSRNSKVISKAR
jgi:hypothetical protein